MTPFPIPYFSTFSTYIYNHLHISLLFIKKEIQNMIINKCGENGVGKTPEGRGRQTENDRNGRPHGVRDTARMVAAMGNRKRRTAERKHQRKKTVTVRDGRRGAEGGKGRNRGDACWPAMQGQAM